MIGFNERPDWHRRAACRGLGSDLFFPTLGSGRGAPGRPSNLPREVKKLCASCPVQAQCLEAGMGEGHGHWAGTSPKQRLRLRKERAA